MTTSEKRPRKIRNTVAELHAQLTLIHHAIHAPPIPVKQLIKMHSELHFFSNNQFPDFAQEKGFSYPFRDTYRVYINADLPSGLDAFTLAHELGHIMLQHHHEYDVDNLTDREYWTLDREADIFAACLLMPEKLLIKEVRLPFQVGEIGRLKNVFGVSWEAMINRLDELGIASKAYTETMFEQHEVKKSAKIPVNYCTSRRDFWRGVPMVDSLIFPDIDEKRRYLYCPSCGNNDFSPPALHCKLCGEPLYNYCSNARERSICGEANAPDALFCEYCGSITVLGQLVQRIHSSSSEVAAAKEQKVIRGKNR
jgi:Zn-dependent peptidase ImmA (M78 family)